jgi:hypothetical protein
MKGLGSADNRIHRAGLNAERAANTDGFIDHRTGTGTLDTIFWIQRQSGLAKQARQTGNAFPAAGRTLVGFGSACGEGLRVRRTAGKATFGALSLRQQIVDLLRQLRSHDSKILGTGRAPARSK